LIFRKNTLNSFELYSYSFILGGTIGNGIDRILKGFVVDFINLNIIDFPVSVLPVKKMWSKFCSINFMDCLLSPSTVIRTSLRKYLIVSFLISFEVSGHFSDGFITAVFPAEKIFTNGFKT